MIDLSVAAMAGIETRKVQFGNRLDALSEAQQRKIALWAVTKGKEEAQRRTEAKGPEGFGFVIDSLEVDQLAEKLGCEALGGHYREEIALSAAVPKEAAEGGDLRTGVMGGLWVGLFELVQARPIDYGGVKALYGLILQTEEQAIARRKVEVAEMESKRKAGKPMATAAEMDAILGGMFGKEGQR